MKIGRYNCKWERDSCNEVFSEALSFSAKYESLTRCPITVQKSGSDLLLFRKKKIKILKKSLKFLIPTAIIHFSLSNRTIDKRFNDFNSGYVIFFIP